MPATPAVDSDGTFDTFVLMELDQRRDTAGHNLTSLDRLGPWMPGSRAAYDFVLTPIAALGLLNPTPLQPDER